MAKKRAFARYTKKGQLVPGSLVVTTKGGYPDKTSLWKEVPVWFNDNLQNSSENYGNWSLITGGVAGDGKVLIDGYDENLPASFTIIGPNDSQGTGWIYLKRYFPLGGTINIQYEWTSFDDGPFPDPNPPDVDRPVYWTSAVEPTGIPGDLTSRVSTTPNVDTWTINIDPGEWLGVGIYSTDSCCGRGFLQIAPSI